MRNRNLQWRKCSDCIQQCKILSGPMEERAKLSTFRATMYFDFRSLAKYTLPNFPWPKGLPMSKSASCHLRSLLAVLAGWWDRARDSGSFPCNASTTRPHMRFSIIPETPKAPMHAELCNI